MNREQWATEHLRGRVWRCGDEDCDCSQAVIETVSPNLDAGYPWVYVLGIWHGTYLTADTYADGEPDADEELKAECARRGIEPE